jgi:hypothetical protein
MGESTGITVTVARADLSSPLSAVSPEKPRDPCVIRHISDCHPNATSSSNLSIYTQFYDQILRKMNPWGAGVRRRTGAP